MSKKINNLRLLKEMMRIRKVEEALADRYSEQEMRCPMHLCIGQEAIAVGVSQNLGITDRVFSNHRAHGHYLAKGGDLKAMVAEIYGRDTGCCGGRGGSMHLIDLSVGFMGATPIVGGTVPLAVGSAWSSKLKGERNVTLVYFGDGCFEEGVVHESMNFAALHNLPVVFVCENNNFSVYTRNDLRQPNRPIWKIAEAHGLNAIAGNGNCIEDVIRLSNKIIEEARYGRPGFIEFSTYRWREHCGPNFDNELGYRSEAEIDSGHDGCPIEYHLRKSQINPDSVLKFNTELEKEISEAFNLALLSRKPTTAESKTHIYA